MIGYVERFETHFIEGWVIRKDGTTPHLLLHVGKAIYPLEPAWLERRDVAGQYGEGFLISGYRCLLPRAVTAAAKEVLRAGQSIEIVADGVTLQNLARMPTSAGLLSPESLLLSVRSERVNAVVESWGYFTVSGWAVVDGRPPSAFTLCCNGEPFDCVVLTSQRPDVAQAFNIEALESGFDVELPGSIWEAHAGESDVRLEVWSGDALLTPEPILLSRTLAARWVDEICQMDEGQEKQYRVLLALEHVGFGSLEHLLRDDTRAYLRDFAGRMHLGKLLTVREQLEPEHGGVPAESPAQLFLWRALRALNARIPAGGAPIMEHVKVVLQEHRLLGEVRESFLQAVVPVVCKTGEFGLIRELLDIPYLKRLESSYDLWEMSLVPPFYIVEGNVWRATELLRSMTQYLDNGWLNTECVRFTVEKTLWLEAEGQIEPRDAALLRLAVIGLFDGFDGRWFSRLHDYELVETQVSLLAALGNYADAHRKEVTAAAIRIYGLNPTFWACMERRAVRAMGELEKARQAWESVAAGLGDGRLSLHDKLPSVLESLEYFLRHGNREAEIYLREVTANVLPDHAEGADVDRGMLIKRLLELGPLEAARIGAAPFAKNDELAKQFPEIFDGLADALRRSAYHPCSPVFQLQVETARLIREIGECTTVKNVAGLSSLLLRLEEKATLLVNWNAHFLGVDALVPAYRIAQACELPVQMALLMRLREAIRKAIAQTSPNGFLPIPVQTALAHLRMLSRDPLLDGFMQETREQMRLKFGARHDELFRGIPASVELELAGGGWPKDTLVVIYSCRKYIDTRVAEIRSTWVQDLVVRGIPYVILVGDGDDSLRGDVLALDVSDRYEDLPKKTLKLFDWVYRHTNAQFVLKIDDDCYLDVERYFDSLSYRKHAYYGRVLRRKEGDMDRLWHQAKSQGKLSSKSIDKSPEPSIYADGGGAYCLSRLAIYRLLQVATSDAGKRLTACSFMEDKLVGDLLFLAGILPSDEDYESYQRRRTFGHAMPVAMWENTFFPSAVTPTKVVHLDTERDLAWVGQNARTAELWPKKLWPTYAAPVVRINSNQLELISDIAKTAELIRNDLVVVVVVRNEMTMLPHFLAHYRMLGVGCFIAVDNCSDDGSREYLHGEPDVVVFSADSEYKLSHYGVAWQQAVMGNLCLGKWVLLADADELLVYPDYEHRPLTAFVEEIAAEGADGVRVDMIDMYPLHDLSDADFTRQSPFEAAPWFDSPPLVPWHLGSGWFSNGSGFVSHLRHRLIPNAVPHDFVSQKFALFRYRPWVRVSHGVHYAANLAVSSKSCWFAHFKYHAGFKSKILTEIKRGQHFDNAKEYRRYLFMLAESSGQFASIQVTRRFEGSQSFLGWLKAP